MAVILGVHIVLFAAFADRSLELHVSTQTKSASRKPVDCSQVKASDSRKAKHRRFFLFLGGGGMGLGWVVVGLSWMG